MCFTKVNVAGAWCTLVKRIVVQLVHLCQLNELVTILQE